MAYEKPTAIPKEDLIKAKEQSTMHYISTFQDRNGNNVPALATQPLQQVSINYQKWVDDATGEKKLTRIVIRFKDSGIRCNVGITDVEKLLTLDKDGNAMLSCERMSYDAVKKTFSVDEVHEESEVAEEDEFDGMDREALKRHIAANGLKDTVKVNKGMTDEDIRTAIRGALELA